MYKQSIENVSHNLLQNVTKLEDALEQIKQDYQNGAQPFLKLPSTRDDLLNIKRVADHIKDNFKDVVILGTGGSSLGAQALAALKGPQVSRDQRVVRVHFPDNLGPHTMALLLRDLDLRRTHFIVISKSGTTLETLAQLISCFSALRLYCQTSDIAEHFTVVVQPGDSPLRRFAESWKLPVHDHDPDLGGRFSIFSLVGLLPALIMDLDVVAFREGANQVLMHTFDSGSVHDIPAAVGASLIYILNMVHNVNINVIMPYGCRMERLAAWYQQLWAESIGKNGCGTTPVRALGPVDQHSQLQLYLDGPRDKFFTVITTDHDGQGPSIDSALAKMCGVTCLSGRAIGDLVAAEGMATIEALIRKGRPLRHIHIKNLNERGLGALMMHFMLETVMAAHLYGVNPFNQPAVELGKELTREYLSQKDGTASIHMNGCRQVA
jgi:glucose-6-phosphate isomerase